MANHTGLYEEVETFEAVTGYVLFVYNYHENLLTERHVKLLLFKKVSIREILI